jgi:ribosomal protein L14
LEDGCWQKAVVVRSKRVARRMRGFVMVFVMEALGAP